MGEFLKKLGKIEITARIAYELDKTMGRIRHDIQEAQVLFDPPYRKLNDGVEIVTIQMKATDKRLQF